MYEWVTHFTIPFLSIVELCSRYSYADFREYIMLKANSENSFLSNWKNRPENNVQIINYNDDSISELNVREKVHKKIIFKKICLWSLTT